MDQKKENLLVGILFLTILAIFLSTVFTTTNSFGGGDHFSHFNLAYWGWKYPDMLFNHWGKPVFTILISPFAQFGINGVRIYNVVVGMLTAFLTWKLAKHFQFNESWVVIILVLFIPIYYPLMFTALTEVTFSFFLVFSIFLFFREKYIWSAVVLSFLPLVITEGIVLFPLFIAAWTLKRQFIALPFLTVGFLLISILGMPFYNDFWWLITEMPYSGSAKNIYGSGPLLHYYHNNPSILGDFMGLMFIIGSLVMFKRWGTEERFKAGDDFYFILLVVGSFVTFYAAHSYVWWKGMGNSLGLIRVIGSVAPLAALTAMAGISLIFIVKNKWWKRLAFVLMLIMLYGYIDDGSTNHSYGFRISRSQELLTETAGYIKSNGLDKNKIYYFNPYVLQVLNLDPRDLQSNESMLLNRSDFHLSGIPDSSIIIWDAHFGPNEGRMPLESLTNQEDLKVVKLFKPAESFKVLGNRKYQIVVFQKDLSQKEIRTNFHLDFESDRNSTAEKAFEGEKSFKLGKHNQYKTLLEIIFEEVSDSLSIVHLIVKLAYNYPDLIEAKELLLVCSVQSAGELTYYSIDDLLIDSGKENKWQHHTFWFDLPKPESKGNIIKIYIWNKGEKEIFLDDVNISFRN